MGMDARQRFAVVVRGVSHVPGYERKVLRRQGVEQTKLLVEDRDRGQDREVRSGGGSGWGSGGGGGD